MDILGTLKETFMEEDGSHVVAAPKKAVPAPVQSGTPVYNATLSSYVAPGYAAPVLSPDDQNQLNVLSQAVYSIPSAYVTFRDVRAAMGNPSNMDQVFQLLTAANKTVTRDKVVSDIDLHLNIVKQKRAEFDQMIANEKASKIDQPQGEITSLLATITQMEADIINRRARVQQLQQDVAAKQQRLQDGSARFKVIEDQLEAPLLQTRQLLTNH